VSPVDSRRKQERLVVLRLLVTVFGWAFTGILVYVLAFQNMTWLGSELPPVAWQREQSILVGVTIGSLIAAFAVALVPLAVQMSPLLGFVPVVLYGLIAILLLIVGYPGVSLTAVVFAALAWAFRR
jgi:hypothetical protein